MKTLIIALTMALSLTNTTAIAGKYSDNSTMLPVLPQGLINNIYKHAECQSMYQYMGLKNKAAKHDAALLDILEDFGVSELHANWFQGNYFGYASLWHSNNRGSTDAYEYARSQVKHLECVARLEE